MRVHRVTWVSPSWESLQPTDPFHPLFVPVERQGAGRFDRPDLYRGLYVAFEGEAAIGESLGNMHTWPTAEIERSVQGNARSLVSIEIPDDIAIINLDDAAVLTALNAKPSDVVRSNRGTSQRLAMQIWESRKNNEIGLTWWSYWKPDWTVAMLWADIADADPFSHLEVISVEPLHADHLAVQRAGEALPRRIL